MDTAILAKHNLNQALLWLFVIFLALRGGINLPLGDRGIIIDFIGSAPNSGRLMLLFYDVIICCAQLVMIVAIHQNTNTYDHHGHGIGRLSEHSHRTDTTTTRHWWAFWRRNVGNAEQSQPSRQSPQRGSSEFIANRDNYRGRINSSTQNNLRDNTASARVSPTISSIQNSESLLHGNSTTLDGDEHQSLNTRRRVIDRIWEAANLHRGNARYERLADTVRNSLDEERPRYSNSAPVEAYDLGGLFIITWNATIRRYWNQAPDEDDGTSSERRPLPV
ncbi:hypothetical protein BDF19DRAFT_415829 [Syncephalis fuscata]|nr:hypothetical protein BDF19DRAFT_415829 [Syncephalis fuscata]